jgi:hypothetical protein
VSMGITRRKKPASTHFTFAHFFGVNPVLRRFLWSNFPCRLVPGGDQPDGAGALRQRAGPSFNLSCVRHHEYDTQLWHHWVAMFAIRHRRKHQRNGDPKY